MNKSILFKAAHQYYKRGMCSSFSEALKMAWRYVRIMEELRKGLVSFAYRKKSNGKVRMALGTLNPNSFSHEYKGEQKPIEDFTIVKYYDMMKGGFRSFLIEKYINK